MRPTRILVLCAISALLVNCGTPTQPAGPIITLSAADIRQTDNYAALLDAYKTGKLQLQGKSPQTHAEDFSRLRILEDKLVELAIGDIESQFVTARGDDGVIKLPTINSIESSLVGAADLPPQKWQRVRDRIALERTRTADQVAAKSKELQSTTDDSTALDLYDTLHALSGESRWLQEKNQYLDQMIASVRAAQEAGQFDASTQAQVALIRQNREQDAALLDELVSFDAKAYESQFLAALSSGDPDGAFEVFSRMSTSDNFDQVLGKLSGTATTMADYFIAKAEETVQDETRIADAYRWYGQAKTMLAELNLPAMDASRMSALLSGLESRFEAAKATNNIESAYAHLLMIADFDMANATYRANIANMRNAVQQRAVKKVTTTEFKSSAQRHDYGSVLSSFITQHLFEKIPNDVRIVERQQYEAIVREQTLSGQAQGLSAVDYLITGNLLESKVDTTEVQGKKIMRVVVGRETIPNPAYTTWLEMSNKDRKKVDQPSETISVDKHENITVGITEHRKLGIVSVGYRLVDSESGKVLFPDSISKSIEHTDNSTEGVEMGEFVLPFKLANLPSDVEILDKLVRELSEEVGTKLVDLLKDQELKYLQIAESGLADNDCNKAVHAFARASGIQELKGLDTDPTLASLKNTAVNCSI